MAKKTTSTSTSIIQSGFAPSRESPATLPDQFLRDMAQHPDPKQAAEIVASHYEKAWLAEHAHECESLVKKVEEAERDFLILNRMKQAHMKQLEAIPRLIRREPLRLKPKKGAQPDENV